MNKSIVPTKEYHYGFQDGLKTGKETERLRTKKIIESFEEQKETDWYNPKEILKLVKKRLEPEKEEVKE